MPHARNTPNVRGSHSRIALPPTTAAATQSSSIAGNASITPIHALRPRPLLQQPEREQHRQHRIERDDRKHQVRRAEAQGLEQQQLPARAQKSDGDP